MDALEHLLAIEAIRRLKARYFRLMDTKDWAGWGDVFTDDAALTFDLAVATRTGEGRPAPTLTGRAAIVDYVSRLFATDESVHHGHMDEIDLTSDTTARGIWAMEDIVDHGDSLLHGWGHYHETYRREADGKWRIATVHLTRLRLRQTLNGRMGV